MTILINICKKAISFVGIFLAAICIAFAQSTGDAVNTCTGSASFTDINGDQTIRIGDGTPGAIQVCITINNLEDGGCFPGSCFDRIYAYASDGGAISFEDGSSYVYYTDNGTVMCTNITDPDIIADGYIDIRFDWDGHNGGASNVDITWGTYGCTGCACTSCPSSITLSDAIFSCGSIASGCGGGPANDYIGNASAISECGTAFTTNNIGGTDCYNECTTESDCGGSGDLDCCDATSSGGNGGADVCYTQTDNDIWYTFCPSEAGTWDISIDIYNCANNEGMQYSVMQGSSTQLNSLLACSNNNNQGSYTESIAADPTNGCIFLNFDGWSTILGKDECTVDVSVVCIDCPSGCAIILPIELTSFNASLSNDNILLTWQTASEVNSDYFTVQRSSGEGEYKDIGRVEAIGGGSALQYNFLDKNPQLGINYYRLKQVDVDGKYTYSDMIGIEYNGSKQLVIKQFTTSASGQGELNVTAPVDSEANIVIYNIIGQKLYSENVILKKGSNQIFINTQNLDPGVYFITIEQNGYFARYKFAPTN